MDTSGFRALVPEPVTLEAFFRAKGQWASGEKFGAAPGASSSSSVLPLVGVVVAGLAIGVGVAIATGRIALPKLKK